MQPTTDGPTTFTLHTSDRVRLWVGDLQQPLIDQWASPATQDLTGTITLTAGEKVPLVLEYAEDDGPAGVQLLWNSPGQSPVVVPQGRLYPVNLNLAVDRSTIDEGNSFLLAGSFQSLGNPAAHTVVVHWGDGSADTALLLAAGQTTFQAAHVAIANKPVVLGPDGQPLAGDESAAVVSHIEVSVLRAGTAEVTLKQALDVTVQDLPPRQIVLAPTSQNVLLQTEEQQYALTGQVNGVPKQDWQKVTVNWGDGAATPSVQFVQGDITPVMMHNYARANLLPGDEPTDKTYQVTVTAADFMLPSQTIQTQTMVTVRSLAPELSINVLSARERQARRRFRREPTSR